MAVKPHPRARVNSSLPLFDWAEQNRSRNAHISPLARMVSRKWGYGPEAAKAVCEAWGYHGGLANA